MYESCFGMQRRPFSATPDPQCWYAGGPYQSALDELVVCAEQGQGIGILIAPAGAGKTLLCERLKHELRDHFDVVYLRHATFNTRRSLLQSLLSELDQPFDKPSDQELRLGLAPVLRRLHQLGRALVLIVDESQQLSESLLEELRILADQAQDGRPLVRLILCGQPGLEEKLVHPAMQSLNQRVRAHVVLPQLSLAEARDYLDYRLTWAGGRTDEIFTDDAADAICHAADGLPRCINQLADHTLLLAYVGDQQPVERDLVVEALRDLSHLPLPWNALPERDRDTIAGSTSSRCHIADDAVETTSHVIDATRGQDQEDGAARHAWIVEPAAESSAPISRTLVEMSPADDCHAGELSVYRLSDRLTQADADVMAPLIFDAATPPAWNEHTDGQHTETAQDEVVLEPSNSSHPATDDFVEEVVLDRYAALDAGLEPPELPESDGITPLMTDDDLPVPTPAEDRGGLTWNAALAQLEESSTAAERLAAVQLVLDAVHTSGEELPSVAVSEATMATVGSSQDHLTIEGLLTATMQELRGEMVAAVDSSSAETSPQAAGAVFEFGADQETAQPALASESTAPESSTRQYRRLFTLLRRKQQGRG